MSDLIVPVVASGGGGGGLTREQVHLTFIGGANAAWTNQPAAETEFLSSASRRIAVDLTGYTQARFQAYVTAVGAAGAVLYPQYSADGGTTWATLDGGVGLRLALSSVQLRDSGWQTLVVGAKAEVLVRMAGSGGDGVADPAFTEVGLTVR